MRIVEKLDGLLDGPFEKLTGRMLKFSTARVSKSLMPMEYLEYGLERVLRDLFKTVLMLILCAVLGIFYYCIFTVVVVGLLRMVAGGIDSKSTTVCFFGSTAIELALIYLSIYITINPYIIIAIIILSLISMFLYAPSDNDYSPIVSNTKRIKLKAVSISIVLVYGFLIFLIRGTIGNIILFAVLINSICILPVVYRLTGTKYGDEYFKEGGDQNA